MTRLLCLLGIHRALWMPVVVLGDASSWLQLKRCGECGLVLGRQHRR